jgi:peroxiredoxin Q/BCP
MILRIGDLAPEFELTSSDGRALRLADLKGKKNVVLYFYPADFTLVCTRETCGFRDQHQDLQKLDTEVIGVSVDSDESHKKFAAAHEVPFALVSDGDRKLAEKYGANDGLLAKLRGVTKRITFVIDKQGRIAGIFDSALRAGQHTDGVRALVEKLAR